MGCNFSKGGKNGAGCIFTNGKLILAGYQPYKKVPVISGIGGSCNIDEDYIETAHRELLEELFGFDGDLSEIMSSIENFVKPSRNLIQGDYVNLVYSFDDLVSILNFLYRLQIMSKFYDEFPQTVEDLLLKRKLIPGSEIQHLVLLPVIPAMALAKEFTEDIKSLLSGTVKYRI